MKAVLCKAYGPPESLVYENSPDPVPGPGEVVVSVRAAGLNFPDTLIIQNKYQFKPELPFSPGSEFAGVVKSAGPGATRFSPGQAVIGFHPHGAFAEEVRIAEGALAELPEGMPFDVAAGFMLVYCTSYHGLVERAGLRAGETLLVLGAAGGVGLAAVEIGKACGARVIAAASLPEKLAICREHGADELIDYASGNLRERVKEITGGKGVDVVYDPVGGPYSEQALRDMAWGGRFLVVGFAHGEIPRIPLNLPLLKNCAIIGVFWGGQTARDAQAVPRVTQALVTLYRQGAIRPRVHARYPFSRVAEAMRAMLAREVAGKVILVP
jgi:NADPH2:quinone reductase